MVTFVKGDILKSPAQVITNPVNCAGVMGKGLALEFKKSYSSMFADYQKRCSAGEVRLGRPYLWEDESTQILIFPTKDKWRDQSYIADIEAGLKYLATNYNELGITSLALPALGCGNGGLPWDKVRQLIVNYLGPIPDLEVFVYSPASEAQEGADPESSAIRKTQHVEKVAAKSHI